MTVIMLISMRHTQKVSRSIQSLGVRQDSTIMSLYALSWIGSSVTEMFQAVIWLVILFRGAELSPDTIERLLYAASGFLLL